MGVFVRILGKISCSRKGKPMTIKQKAKPFRENWLLSAERSAQYHHR
jgi:hypothetical protein